jgi:hypothetical protein
MPIGSIGSRGLGRLGGGLSAPGDSRNGGNSPPPPPIVSSGLIKEDSSGYILTENNSTLDTD